MVCCSPWGCQELDATEQLNNKERTHTDVLTSNGPSDLSEPSLSLVSFLDALPHVPTWCSKIFSNEERKKGGEASWVWGGLKDYLVQWFSKGICSPGKTHIPRPCPGKTESPGEEGQGLGKTWVKEATQVTLSMPLIKSLYSYPFVFLSEETQVPER